MHALAPALFGAGAATLHPACSCSWAMWWRDGWHCAGQLFNLAYQLLVLQQNMKLTSPMGDALMKLAILCCIK